MSVVGFIGLGKMGYYIASNLNKSFKTYVWNRTLEKSVKHSQEFETEYVEDKNMIPEKCHIIFFCLPTHLQVQSIIDELEPVLNESHILIDCTSSDYKAQREIYQKLIILQTHTGK